MFQTESTSLLFFSQFALTKCSNVCEYFQSKTLAHILIGMKQTHGFSKNFISLILKKKTCFQNVISFEKSEQYSYIHVDIQKGVESAS